VHNPPHLLRRFALSKVERIPRTPRVDIITLLLFYDKGSTYNNNNNKEVAVVAICTTNLSQKGTLLLNQNKIGQDLHSADS